MRASTFAAHALGNADPTSIKVPIIGGHSGATILPLYSQAQPPIDLGAELPNVIKLKLGEQGALEVFPFGNLSDNEAILLEKAVKELKVDIQTGLSFEEQNIYAAAKFALIGLTKTLSIEGKEYNISVNAVATAGFTDQVVANNEANQGQELMKQFVPAAQASPAVAWLVHEDCKVTGEIVGAMGNIVTRIFVAETHGFQGAAGKEWTPETIRDNWSEVDDGKEVGIWTSTDEMGAAVFPHLMGA
ncbi:short-chain dehydrogenase reductase sdr [Fusarium napiforme]|uniref:Short-chain dehydrogenase reductase sdr n=1 Tax=Fusarium napiforme TaxID=42672 RepID=A0A8H5NKA9_9HYPO|nr:short-chain dehydrogenase reductase sdr [Fusarium napiforme]